MWKYFRDKGPQEIVKNILHLPLVFLLWIFLEILRLNRHVFVVNLGYKGRITHYIYAMEMNLRVANSTKQRFIMIFVNPVGTPNNAVRDLYRRYSIIIDSRLPNIVRRTFQIFSVLFRRRFSLELPGWHEIWKLEPATALNKAEIEYGRTLLKEMGIPEQREFVCLGVKDGSYYATIHPENDYGQDLRHQLSDSTNVDIDNYLPIANQLAEIDIYTVRMGSVVSSPLKADRSPKVIDYAFDFRTELGDLALGALCKFFINGMTGSHVFAAIYNKPSVVADFFFENDFNSRITQFDRTPNSIWIIRRYRTINDIELDFKQIIQRGKELTDDRRLLAEGLVPIPNTPDEISDLVFELIQELGKNHSKTKYYENLQDNFYNNFSPPIPWRDFNISISERFLQKHVHLI